MKKNLIFLLLCGLILVALAGCEKSQGINTIPSGIPTNVSVNTAWGGFMCEADGFIYYVSAANDKESIVRMEQDGSNPTTVTAGDYYYIEELTSDGAFLYFVASSETDDMNTIYRLPLNGGKEQKVAQGYIFNLQYAKGKLYWKEYYQPSGDMTNQTTSIQIKCVNPNGSDLQTLLTLQVFAEDGVPFEFLAIEDGLYYATESLDDDHCDIYRMDLSGQNSIKINSGRLETVDKLFYDEGKLYFLMQHFNGFSDIGFWDSLETLDETGETKTIVDKVGYFPQDFGDIEYCGISNSIFYYFVLNASNDTSENLFMDLHQFDLVTNRDTVILHNVEMGDQSVGILNSVRGKSIKNDGVIGLYILGNDIYFSPYAMP